MKITAQQLRKIIVEEVEMNKLRNFIKNEVQSVVKENFSSESGKQVIHNKSKNTRGSMMLEGYNRITPEEMKAWMSGDWGYVAEAGPPATMLGGKRLMEPAPGDIEGLATFIERNADFRGAAQQMGVDMNSEEMRQYIGDNLAGKYPTEDIDAALKML